MRRIGVLIGLAEDDPEKKARLAAFRQGLDKLGWSEGRNVRIDISLCGWQSGSGCRCSRKSWSRLQPDVILAHSTPSTAALQRETRTIPIVFVGRLRPGRLRLRRQPGAAGRQCHGLALFEASITGKWLAMLKEIAPGMSRAALYRQSKENSIRLLRAIGQGPAPSLGDRVGAQIRSRMPPISSASSQTFAREPNGGLFVLPGTL